jgi:hypothetical protein
MRSPAAIVVAAGRGASPASSPADRTRHDLGFISRIATSSNCSARPHTGDQGRDRRDDRPRRHRRGEALYEALLRLSKKKPTVAQGTVGASTAYMAAIARPVIARRTRLARSASVPPK